MESLFPSGSTAVAMQAEGVLKGCERASLRGCSPRRPPRCRAAHRAARQQHANANRLHVHVRNCSFFRTYHILIIYVMPRRGGRKNSTAHLVYGDTPEIEALSTGFARKGYYYSGYDEKARIFANMTTSNSLAARIKPDGTHAPVRYAYATGIYEPDTYGRHLRRGNFGQRLSCRIEF